MRLSGAEGIVLGLSGGIDSCVALALAKEALGTKRVLALLLPIHSNPQDAADALCAARSVGAKTKTVDLTRVYDSLVRILPAAKASALANLKPRLRMAVLYYYANKLNYLVCGTGNKAEISVGYFTKHGDGAADILPLGDLLKKDVRLLAQELGIPRRIIEKPPTAGLWPGQTDEGELGILYDELDDILERKEKGLKQRVAAAKVRKVERMIAGSAHKRERPKVCPV